MPLTLFDQDQYRGEADPITLDPSYREYEFDPSILKRLRVGEAQGGLFGGEWIINNRDKAIYGVVSELDQVEDQENASEIVAGSVERHLAEQFDENEPEVSMRKAFDAAQADLVGAAAAGASPEMGAEASILKFYTSDGELKAAYGHIGNNRIYKRSAGSIQLLTEDDSPGPEAQNFFDASGKFYHPRQFGVVSLKPEDRLVLASIGIIGETTTEELKVEEMNSAMSAKKPQTAAERFVEYGKGAGGRSALVVDVPMPRRRLADRLAGLLGRRERDNDASERKQRLGARIGALSLGAGVAATNARERIGSYRQSWTEREGGRFEKGNRLRTAAIIGGVALAAYIAYRVGEATIFDFNDGKDKGIDLLPWPKDGLDLNPGRKTSFLNDDTIAGVRQKQGVDIAPSFIDGDGFDLWPGRGLISDDAGVSEAGSTEVSPPVDPPPPAEQSLPPVWRPQVLDFEPGGGFRSEIHELGHKQVGFENFTDKDAGDVYRTVRARFGNNLISPIDPGVDEYLRGNDLWVARPGRAQWASEQIERAIREEIAKAA